MWLVDVLKPGIIVELGTQHGDSYCAFCQAVSELNMETLCYAIDSWQGDAHAGHYGPEILANLRAHHDPLYDSFSRLIQSSFDNALKYFEEETIDLLHIDGYHTYEAIKHDFESWLPKMSSRGIVLFHDINVQQSDFGVWKFWAEIKEKYPHFEFLHRAGIGLMQVGDKPSTGIRLLLEARDEEKMVIRNYFTLLGQRVCMDGIEKANVLRINNLETQLQVIQQGIAIQLIKKYQRIVDKLLRRGTFMRKGYDLILKGLRLIIGEGLRAFIKKFVVWFRFRKTMLGIRIPRPFKALTGNLQTRRNQIAASGLFDAEWYLGQNPDIRALGMDPLEHYLRIGADEGLNPNPLFYTSIYVRAYGGRIRPQEALLHFYKSKRLFAPGAYRTADVLLTIQRKYQANTDMKCIRDIRNGEKRFAVYYQCGSGSLHDQWLNESPRAWDLIVNHYDSTYIGRIACDVEFQQTGLEPGTKVTSFYTVLKQWPHLLNHYDYIMLLDDDIVFPENGIDDLFTISRTHSLDLAQASLSADSHCAYPAVKNQGTRGIRYLNYVEIMMPVLSKRVFNIGRHLFGQTISGWGADAAMGNLIADNNGKAAIIDSVIARHTKPIDYTNGAFYIMLHKADIYPEIEFSNMKKIYNLGPENLEEIPMT